MKREGRQHGHVQVYTVLPAPFNPRPERRHFNIYTSPPTAGAFTKVPSKPTNHSKYTSRCGRPRCRGCHTHPVCKSSVKAKGTQKLRPYDVVSKVEMHTFGGLVARPGRNFHGISATEALETLTGDYYDAIMSTYHYDDGFDHQDCIIDEQDSSYSTTVDFEGPPGGALEIAVYETGGGEEEEWVMVEEST